MLIQSLETDPIHRRLPTLGLALLLLLTALALPAGARTDSSGAVLHTSSSNPPVVRDDCVDRAEVDPVYGPGSGGHALWLPGIGRDFVFDLDPGQMVQEDGTALLTGTAHRASNPAEAFEVAVHLAGYTTSPPPGSPKKELQPSAYSENGGPVDTDSWWYFTELSGVLTGIGAYSGAVIELDRAGPAFQVGYGANGKNLRFGASSWLTWIVVAQPTSGSLQLSGQGDFNLNLSGCTKICVDEADADLDYLAITAGGDALQLLGIARDFVFSGSPQFVEYDDGTARLIAELYKATFPNHRFMAEIYFAGRTTTPPPGSPKLELPDIAYNAHGGPVNPDGWHYFPAWGGVLTGKGFLEGAVLEVQGYGPAFQVGAGASGKNVLYGGSGWLEYTVVEQPNNTTLPTSGIGDMSVNECPPERPASPMDACAPMRVVSYEPGVSATANSPLAERMDPASALGIPQDTDEQNFVALGFGGSIVLDFEALILNHPGDDLHLYNTTYAAKSCGEYPERAKVLVSRFGNSWVEVGTTCQDGGFDLGNLSWARYVMIQDMSDMGSFFDGEAADGFDVDGIVTPACGRLTQTGPRSR